MRVRGRQRSWLIGGVVTLVVVTFAAVGLVLSRSGAAHAVARPTSWPKPERTQAQAVSEFLAGAGRPSAVVISEGARVAKGPVSGGGATQLCQRAAQALAGAADTSAARVDASVIPDPVLSELVADEVTAVSDTLVTCTASNAQGAIAARQTLRRVVAYVSLRQGELAKVAR